MLDVQIFSSVETSVTSPPRPSSPSTSHANGLFSPNLSDTGTPEPISPGTASDDAVSLSLPSSLVKKQSIVCSKFQTPGDLQLCNVFEKRQMKSGYYK